MGKKWQVVFVGNIPIGVGMVGEHITEMVCNSILPDTDEEFDAESERINSVMKLIASAPELFEMLSRITDTIKNLDKSTLSYGTTNRLNKAVIVSENLLNSILK